MIQFEFFRFRFHFRALDPVRFPGGKSGNIIRGALGMVLHDTASPAAYARLFEPRGELGQAPSGLSDWPRPFILRSSHLDGQTFSEGGLFHFDVHVFDLRGPVLAYFRQAFAEFGGQGIGPGHGRAALEQVEQIDLEDRIIPENEASALTLELESSDPPVASVRLRFLTPTELKSGGAIAPQPGFAILFARLRDRISTLRALYGPGPLSIDFRALGGRAERIRVTASDLKWETVQRRSGRTGQVHPLGGFTGEVEYAGDLAGFLPWLRAARWVGVGRQTVWGKGDVRVV